MPRKRKTEPEIEVEDNADELESMDDESREHWLRHPYTRQAHTKARQALVDSRKVLYQKAGASNDPAVVAAHSVYQEKLQLCTFLKEGQS